MSLRHKIKELKTLSNKITQQKEEIDKLREEKYKLEINPEKKQEKENLIATLRKKREELKSKKEQLLKEKELKKALFENSKLFQSEINKKKSALTISFNKITSLKKELEDKINLSKLTKQQEKEIMQKLNLISKERIAHKNILSMQKEHDAMQKDIQEKNECIKLLFEQNDSLFREISHIKNQLSLFDASVVNKNLVELKEKISEKNLILKNLFEEKKILKSEIEKMEEQIRAEEKIEAEQRNIAKHKRDIKREIQSLRVQIKIGNADRYNALKKFLCEKKNFIFSISEIQLLREFNFSVFSTEGDKNLLREKVLCEEKEYLKKLAERNEGFEMRIRLLEEKFSKV